MPIQDMSIKQYLLERSKKKKSVKESIASLEEQLFEAEKAGNKKKQEALKKILKCLKKPKRVRE